MNLSYEIIEATEVKVECFTQDYAQCEAEKIILSNSIKIQNDINRKLYKNRYQVDRDDKNILATVKIKKLDQKLYRNSAQKNTTRVISNADNHNIRSISF